ncbi:4Fe-4S binding protein [Natranaerofaba carboxydovora]|uniref:4Fe-4S binding protein n=1 Tax=Natranaerofaba carboxydovora TaxID=2742683 RepID=UPI001F146A8A|nr:4Fe-4S binding protein [Natranaerofaba carboxydovora]
MFFLCAATIIYKKNGLSSHDLKPWAFRPSTVILYLVIIGVGISFFFTEDFWHRICPHGAILNITSRISPFGMKIDRSSCNGCSLCEKVCPNQAISKYNDTKQRVIDNKECLVCYDCQKVCPKNAISYGKVHGSYQEQEKEAVNS